MYSLENYWKNVKILNVKHIVLLVNILKKWNIIHKVEFFLLMLSWVNTVDALKSV